MTKNTEVEKYISKFPDKTQKILNKMRTIIKKAAPEAIEGIYYEMPGYKLNKKPLVYFAAYENHIGFYATPTGHAKFAKKLAKYKQGKGSVQFPLSEEIPYDLIEEMTEFRVKQNQRSNNVAKKYI